MKPINFLIFITHKALLILSKFNSEDIEVRVLNVVSSIFFNLFVFFYGVAAMLLISNNLIAYNRPFFFCLLISMCVTIAIFIHKTFRKNYYNIIEESDKKYRFTNLKYLIVFLVSFLTPIMMIGIGLIFLRKLLYQ